MSDFGFVPNGTRVYYLDRSQPPLLTLMALAIFEATGDAEWLAEALPLLVKEYDFWMAPKHGHRVGLEKHKVGFNVYRSKRRGPRPETW